jgi:hypothetical protein
MNWKIEVDSGEVWFKMIGAQLHAALERKPDRSARSTGRPSKANVAG